jgi:CheY-like chemotaxis protein
MRRYLVSLLNPYCEVVEAGNGLEALEAAQRRQPDLIITDYMSAPPILSRPRGDPSF